MGSPEQDIAKGIYIDAIDRIAEGVRRLESSTSVSRAYDERGRSLNTRAFEIATAMLRDDGYLVNDVDSYELSLSTGWEQGDLHSRVKILLSSVPGNGPHARVLRSDKRYFEHVVDRAEQLADLLEANVRVERTKPKSEQIIISSEFKSTEKRFAEHVRDHLRYSFRNKGYRVDIAIEPETKSNTPNPVGFKLVLTVDLERLASRPTGIPTR